MDTPTDPQTAITQTLMTEAMARNNDLVEHVRNGDVHALHDGRR